MLQTQLKLLTVLSALSLAACSEDPEAHDKRTEPFKTADAVAEPAADGEPAAEDTDAFELIGGVVANPADYAASVRISSGNASCTATVVGKRSVFTAAHCVANGGTIRFSAAGKTYSGRCVHHQNYRGNSTADWALCYTNADVTGVAFEVVNTNPAILKQGGGIQLSGYGCRAAGGRGGSDGRYRIGDSNIIRVPAPTGNNHDIVTRGQGAALCFGDSGGPAFVYLDAERKERVLVGVNSRGDIRTTSYLSSVSQATAVSWMTNWAASNNTEICGVTPNAQNCRMVSGSDNEMSQECAAMEKAKALEQVTKCARLDGELAATCSEAQDLVAACIQSRMN